MSPAPGSQLPPGVPHPAFFTRPDEVDAARRERHAPEPGTFGLLYYLSTDCWHIVISILSGCLSTVVVMDSPLPHRR